MAGNVFNFETFSAGLPSTLARGNVSAGSLLGVVFNVCTFLISASYIRECSCEGNKQPESFITSSH